MNLPPLSCEIRDKGTAQFFVAKYKEFWYYKRNALIPLRFGYVAERGRIFKV